VPELTKRETTLEQDEGVASSTSLCRVLNGIFADLSYIVLTANNSYWANHRSGGREIKT
jgi:hypothetical protein